MAMEIECDGLDAVKDIETQPFEKATTAKVPEADMSKVPSFISSTVEGKPHKDIADTETGMEEVSEDHN